MDMKVAQHRPALMAAMVGAGVVAGSMVAVLVKSWYNGSQKRPRVPITILAGFLGAGKTTLLSRLLKNANGLRIAVLVNDLAEVNVDARMLLAGDQASTLAAFSQLENGCLCCSTEADVVGAVTKLLEAGGEIDHLVIECSGMAQPSSLIELFTNAEEEGHVYKSIAMLTQMVTLVDGRTLLRWLEVANGSTTLVNIGDEAGSLAELLVEQIEWAGLIILSKVDCLQQAQIRKCLAAIRAFNASAVIENGDTRRFPKNSFKDEAALQCASFGDVSPTVIFGTTTKEPLSSNRKKKNSHTHHDFHDHHGHEDAPHVRSFVFKSWCPFQPQRLGVTLRRLRSQIEASSEKQGLTGERKCLGRGVLRAKGLVWLATDMKRAREWAQVGETLHLHYGDLWKEEWTAVENGKAEVGGNGESYGDRRQEVAFIGTGEMQEVDIRNALDSCLLTAEEMGRGPYGWQDFADPIVITPVGPRHKKPTTHGVGCACCDPELKSIDQAVARQIG